MNYVCDAKYEPVFQEVFGNFFKRVEPNEARYDFVFKELDKELLQEISSELGGRDKFYKEFWFPRSQAFYLYKLPSDILYLGNGEIIQRLFRLFSEVDSQITVRGYSVQAFGYKQMIHEYYMFIYRVGIEDPFLNNFGLNHDNKRNEDDYNKESIEIFRYVLNEIKKVLF